MCASQAFTSTTLTARVAPPGRQATVKMIVALITNVS
jgi:hypothetical protein